jgi:hypothetical protein
LKNYFSQLLNVHTVSDVGQIENTAEALGLRPSHLEVEIATAQLKEYKSPDNGKILTELIQAGGETLVL